MSCGSELFTSNPKPWTNIHCQSIDSASGIGSSGPFHITETTPSTITAANFATFSDALQIYNSGPTGDTGFSSCLNMITPSGQFKMGGTRDGSNTSIILVDNKLAIETFTSGGSITLLPNLTFGLSVNYVSPGVTSTVIQNEKLTGSSVVGYIPTTLNYYEELDSAYVFSGPWGATTYTRNIHITRIGRSITLSIDAIVQTASAGAVISSSTNLPARFIPSASADSTTASFTCDVINNSVVVPGNLNISSSGSIVISFINAAFPLNYIGSLPTNTCGFNNLSISYSV